jgi:amino acid adenylation domain-containing protein
MPRQEPVPVIPVRAREPRSGADSLAHARRALFDLRTRRMAADRAEVVPVPRDRSLPLSFAQQQLWFLDQWVAGQPVYNSPMCLRIRGPLDGRALAAALTNVVRRHEALRTRYESDRGVPYQVIEPPPDDFDIPLLDLPASGAPAAECERSAREEVGRLSRLPFDLRAGPLLRASLVRIAVDDHMLGLCLHHIATDGWSGAILINELIAGYQAAVAGHPAVLPELAVQYADYAVWQRQLATSDVIGRQLEYWRTKLAGLPVLDLLPDHVRPAVPEFRGQALTLDLPDSLRTELTVLALRERVTLLTVLLSAFVALLARYTGQDDIVVGSIFSGRTRPEIDPLIGFFANTLVLRTNAGGNPPFRELLARARETVLGAHLNQDVTFNRLVDELRPERDPGRNPLFQVCFTMQHATERQGNVGGAAITSELVDPGTSRFDVAVHVTEVPGQGLELWMEFSTELFDPRRMRRLPCHFARILHQVAERPEIRLGDLEIIDPVERQAILDKATAPYTFPDSDRSLDQLVSHRAAAEPARLACRFLGHDLSYGELDARANQLARMLRCRGVGPESVVGVLLDRGLELPVSLLAVLKAGGAYLPLDPLHPEERIHFTVHDAGCAIVLTTRQLADLLPADVTAIALDLDAVANDLAEQAATDLPASAGSRNAAYLIYTSGSTGKPKGVVVEHRQIVNFTLAVARMFQIGPGDRLLQFANPAFDTSAFDFYGALATGATLVQAPTSVLHDPAALAALMRTERVTVTDLPPTVLAELDPSELPALRALFVGMEPFPAELVNRWTSAGVQFHNGYGPTEATVACIDYLCPEEPLRGSPPIGMPMANNTAYVIDRFGALAPAGVLGELYVGGSGVARGYHRRPGLTAERFLPSPFGPPGARLYRTGDLASRDEDGILTFRGRSDDQIKIRGMRIEPGEIEARLLEHPDVQQALVLAWQDPGATQLVGYVIARPGSSPDTDTLRRHVAASLPLFMVPAVFAVLDAFPKNVNGKVDRARLPAPSAGTPALRTAPKTSSQRALAEIWCGVLGVTDITVEDDFFALGGNSLKFAQIASRISEACGVTIDLRSLFTHPTLASLADLIDEQRLEAVPEPDLSGQPRNTEPAPPVAQAMEI